MAGPVAFVGREGELSRLLGALGGDARLVLVTGDAGVGKTRFIGEGMARAAAGGMVVLRGECLPLSGTLPLLPVASALGELGRLDGGKVLEAALETAPEYVRDEVGRLVPGLGPGRRPGAGGRDGGWRRERLFAGVAELLDAVAGAARSGAGLVVEDVHWADSATLDFLTYLASPGRRGAVRVVVTCRGDEAPLAAPVASWLAQARGGAGVEEITLGPLSQAEVAEQVAALVVGPVPPGVVDEVFARAEGNPFFTEQLVAALPGRDGGTMSAPAGLPARLAGLLTARADRCAGDARAVLDALAVAGRSLAEDQLGVVSGLRAEAVRQGLRQLATARLLADGAPGRGHRPRHALLAEAVVSGLLPGERVVLHERTARMLEEGGGDALAAEAASHWAEAGRPAEELPARLLAAQAAERVFGYAEAGAHWRRAIELVQTLPGAAGTGSVDLPQLYVRAIGAVELSGDTRQAGLLAEEAYHRFAGHPDHATAAVIHQRAGYLRGLHDPDAGCPLMERALELFGQGPPSAEHAEALFQYAIGFLLNAYGRFEDHRAALTQALQIAEAANASAVVPRILARIPIDAQDPGAVLQVIAKFHRSRAAAEAAGDDAALLEVAVDESDVFLQMASFTRAEEVALHGLQAARRAGLDSWFRATLLAGNAAEAMLFGGRTAEAAALIDPLTTGPPRRDDWFTHLLRAHIDMLRGDLAAATARQQQVNTLTGHFSSVNLAREAAQLTVEVALWAGRPADALQEVRQALAPYEDVPDLTDNCGQLLVAGMRACADLAEQARARRDHDVARAAQAAAGALVCMTEQMKGLPFTESPFLAQIPANRATWDAEQTRLAGASDPDAWHTAAKTWETLGWPHRAGYAWWRRAQAQLAAGQPVSAAAAALRAAAAAADGHAPLHAQVCALAERARTPLRTPAHTPVVPPPTEPLTSYGLTSRELTVLRLLAAGRTNAQIGAELYISPTTARVHVSNILRKLGVSNRVQAAALAERAGLLRSGHS